MYAQFVKLEDVKAAEYNPRRISEQAARRLKHSLARYGDISGIVWNRRTGNLVAGHQRMSQLKELGAEFHNDGNNAWMFYEGNEYPIRIVDWDDVTEKAANVAANNQSIAGEFDKAQLTTILGEVVTDIGVEDFQELGFEDMVKDLRLQMDIGDIVPLEMEPVADAPEPPAVRVHICPECGAEFTEEKSK